jgi:hypothetical protein
MKNEKIDSKMEVEEEQQIVLSTKKVQWDIGRI